MKKSNLLIFLFFVIITLTACRSTSEPVPTETTFEIIHLQISPALQHWLADIAACADGIPNFGITIEVLPDSALDLNKADLLISLGDRQESDQHVSVLGTEEIVIFTGQELDPDAISLESLHAIYNGSITNWDELAEFTGQNSVINHPITILSYPAGDILRELFTDSFLSGTPITNRVEVFSTIDYLSAYLEDHPHSIGYVLVSQMPQNARQLEITGFDQASAIQYVLAITQEEPSGNLRQLLLCIQD